MCPPRVTRQLKSVDGVLGVTVTFKPATARVRVKPKLCSDAGASTLIAALKSPYGGKLKKIERPDKSSVTNSGR